MSETTRRWGLIGACVLAVAGGIAAGPGTPTKSGEPTRIALTTDDARAVWSAASQGGEADLLSLLSGLAGDDPGEFADSVALFRTNLEAREADRAAEIDRVRGEFDEHLAEHAETDDPIKLSQALGSAIELQLLMRDDDAFFADPRVVNLVELASGAAREAEAAGDWLISNELFYLLDTLYDKERTYRADVERLTRRLAMIRLYNPGRMWELRNARRVAAGEDPLPPYNPYGDDFHEKLDGVGEALVLRALDRAALDHVERRTERGDDGITMVGLLRGGLDAIETMASTDDLYPVFDGLEDPAGRKALEDTLEGLRAQLETTEDAGLREQLRALREVLRVLLGVNERYGLMDKEALLHEFGNGAMSVVDDYTAIIWPDELARFRRSTQANFVGVGIQIQHDELMNIKVVTPLEGTPAQRAGLRAGDIIKAVNGVSAVGLSLDQAVAVITGPPNTEVTLTIEREIEGADEDAEPERIDFTLTRRTIDLPTVKGWEKTGASDNAWDYYIDPESKIGYIRLTGFAQTTTADFDAAIAQLRDTGLNGLILDLRYNPGGLLDQAVRIANRFVPQGLIVRTEDAEGRNTDTPEYARRLSNDVALSDLPVVVLINEGSASASEIVSGAIQAGARRGGVRALILGQRSFGKGSVQQVFPLPGGGAMKLTTQYYRVDSPRLIHRVAGSVEWGIEPDLAIDMLPKQQEAAILLRRSSDMLALDENGVVIVDEDRPNPNTLLTDGVDLQVQAALVLLQSQVGVPGLHASKDG